MEVTRITKVRLRNGKIRGTMFVKDGRRRHSVRYERLPSGYAEQWGAPYDVLCATYSTFMEAITEPNMPE